MSDEEHESSYMLIYNEEKMRNTLTMDVLLVFCYKKELLNICRINIK